MKKNKAMPADELARIAATVCDGICRPGQVADAARGPSVLVFEEYHTSRLGRLQMAMALVRLYYTEHLRDMGLEGYLMDKAPFDVSWAHALHARDPIGLESTAVRMLEEGEINAAEFMALLYKDFAVHRIEQSADYGSATQNDPTSDILDRIAEQSLTNEQGARLEAISKQIASLDPAHREAKVQEARGILAGADPWVKRCLERLDATDTSLDEELALLDEIERKADERGVELSDEDKRGMAGQREFLKKRDRASATMSAATVEIAKHSKDKLLAMVVGAAHTREVKARLQKAEQQAIVLTPLALAAKEGELSADQFERKGRQESVDSDEIVQQLARLAKMNPEPVVGLPWFRAKSELYFATDRVANAFLGGDGPPPPGGGPRGAAANGGGSGSGGSGAPARLPFDGFDGKWIHIDPAWVERKDENGSPVVVFKAVVTGANGEREEIWGKAALAKDERPTTGERERVEAMLRDAFDRVKQGEGVEKAPATGRVRVTSRVVAVFAKTKKEVLAKALRAI